MKLEFTNNAQARMLDRGIREADVTTAIESPEQLVPCIEKKCWYARKTLGARTLEVVLIRDLLQTQIITAYWQEPK
jgi:hypothetical protein